MDIYESDELDLENRFMSTSYTPNDTETEVTLRPRTLDDWTVLAPLIARI